MTCRMVLAALLGTAAWTSNLLAAPYRSCGGSRNGTFTCSHCQGTGLKNGTRCSLCNGRRFQRCATCNGSGQSPVRDPTPTPPPSQMPQPMPAKRP